MEAFPFRILSLNGGGVRGLFQAVVLKNIQRIIDEPIYNFFDLISGTSTGAIIALALSIGIDIDRIIELYLNKSKEIFKPKNLAIFRQGGRYKSSVLKNELLKLFENNQLRDVKTKVLVTSSCLDNFTHRVFSSFHKDNISDKELLLADIAMASSAAPTYFDPVKPNGQERSYLDGGLWANSPSLISVIWAHRFLHIPLENIRLLSIGTGTFPKGLFIESFKSNHILSFATIRSIFEIMFSSQESSADFHAKELIGSSNFFKINCILDEKISLDDSEKAKNRLPALAEMAINDNLNKLIDFLTRKIIIKTPNIKIKNNLVSYELIEAAGLSGFYPSRKYYQYRKETSTIDSYIETAQKTLIMVSINLMTGITFDNICKVLKSKLENKEHEFKAIISLLNPYKADLIFAISPVFKRPKEHLFNSIMDTLKHLKSFKDSLSSDAKNKFEIRVHNALPFGSAILLDHKEKFGRIQIETKPYQAVLNDSFAFEFIPSGSSGLYGTLVESYLKLLKDGASIEEIELK